MSNEYDLSGSGERLSFFKLFTEKNFKIEIPIIQRDYAQGRSSEEEVRNTFLNALFEYLQQGKPNRDLDFVYGTVLEDGKSSRFIPLDGQQRLTTLFLLHWYLGHRSNQSDLLKQVLGKNNKSQFSYETRTSSSEFCDALIVNDIDLNNLLETDSGLNNSLSNTIKDKGWFYLSWINDPTIQSMLIMLDAIHCKFSNYPEFFQLLIDEEQPVITFLYLNLKEFNLTDDLYIKMNARGKPLTPFENFKAKFEKKIKGFQGDLAPYQLDFKKKEEVNGYQYFIHKIDTDWADLFWGYRNSLSNDETFDDEIMNFIRLIISNYHLLNAQVTSEEPVDVRKRFYETGGKLRELSFIEYSELGCFSQGLVTQLISMFDLFYSSGLLNGKIKPYLDDDSYYSENGTFVNVIKNEASYPDKLRFFAFYTYLAKGWKGEDLQAWTRVIYNLTENRIINTSEEFYTALSAINALSSYKTSILETLIEDCEILGFSGAQVVEEKIKAHLMLKSSLWSELILSVEKQPFFNGQIGFILNFSGILEFYRKHHHCDWSAEQNEEYYNTLDKYSKSSSALFKLIGQSSASIDYLWERAVLSKGIYFTKQKGGNRFNLLSTRETKNNILRDQSWKRLLRIGTSTPSANEEKQAHVKAVLDDPDFDYEDIQVSLDVICQQALNKQNIEDWRKSLIKHKELFEYCKQGFIYISDKDVTLLSESQRNHYHSDIYTKTLSLELDKNQVQPFTAISYEPVKSKDDWACVVLRGFNLQGSSLVLKIAYYSSNFYIWLKCNETLTSSSSLHTILDKHGFSTTLELKIEKTKNDLSEITGKITALCADFQGVINE
jgi:hypothetical protein